VSHVPVASPLEGPQHLEPEIERAVLLAHAAKAREAAAQLQRVGDAEAARNVMRAASEALRASPEYQSPAEGLALRRDAEEFDALAEQYAHGAFSELEAKYQMQRSYNTRRGKQGYDEKLRRKRGE
jgi:hypothetical protein